MMTHESFHNPPGPAPLVDLMQTLVRTARAAHPDWDEWALTMNPETFALLDPTNELIEAPDPVLYAPRSAPRWDGCEVYALPLLEEVVFCSPVFPWTVPGTPNAAPPAPPDYRLDLTTGSITPGAVGLGDP